MKKIVLALLVLGCISMNQKTFAEDFSKIVGTWKIEATDAPSPYAKSVLTLAEVDGKLTAKLVFESGQTLKPGSVTYSKGAISFYVNIEGSEIQISGKLDKNKIIGKADSPDGPIDFTAVKKETPAVK